VCEAILGHGEYTGVPRTTPMARACSPSTSSPGSSRAALIKPSRRVADVDVATVRKRMKDKAFARGVSREDVVRGAAELGVPLDEHVGVVIGAMQAEAGALGL
jgi:predicted hydrolase (HD superfamily)